MSDYTKGSEWRKWDLHIHTPLSIIQNYGGNTLKSWELFISDLENLPEEFKIIGINDYIFLDGYKKVLEFKNNGRLQNIDLILPVVELRLDKFGSIGDAAWKKVNFHIIFSNEVTAAQIEQQFLNAIFHTHTLSPEYSDFDFSGVITRESLVDFGRKVKDSSSVNVNGSDIIIGFNNITYDYSKVLKTLESTYFTDKYITAVGKTEWDVLRWNGSISTKKTIINNADLVFISAESVDSFNRAKQKLSSENVNDLLIDCSDSHSFSSRTGSSDKPIKDRIGNCLTWIKADPTFEGLKQIIYEPNDRLFVGDRPEVLDRVDSDKTRYISSLNIKQNEGYNETKGVWFKDLDIELNKELVTIIGNKGNGKSALSDIIGLLGNTHNANKSGIKKPITNGNFSFLVQGKFLKNRLADSFTGTLTWEDTQSTEKVLGEEIDPYSLEKVRYLPQNYFEELTNDLNGEGFKNTLEDVVFRHLPSEQRMKNSFSELRDYKQAGIKEDISLLKKELENLNTHILDLERKKHPNYLLEVKSKIQEKGNELAVQVKLLEELFEIENPEVAETRSTENRERFTSIEEWNSKVKELDQEIDTAREEYSELLEDKEILTGILTDFDRYAQQIESYKLDKRDILSKFEISIDEVLKIEKNYFIVQNKIDKFLITLSTLSDKLLSVQKINILPEDERENKADQSLFTKKDKYLAKISEIKKELSAQEKLYQDYVEGKNRLERKKNEIQGTNDTPETLLYYKELKRILEEDIPAKLDVLVEKRYRLSQNIFEKKQEIIELFNEFKKPVDDKVQQYSEYLSDYPIKIEVSFKLDDNFFDKFLDFILKNKKGSFKDDGDALIRNILLDKDINDKDVLCSILKDIIDKLKLDDSKNEDREISNQIKNVSEFYSYLFSLDYLQAVYELKLGEKSLDELSPGEKGTLLLVFYLMIDDEKIPLIIDQPEDNLDNKSVFEMLTKFIKLAKKQRQIIIVTHNPNLAVCADAEQIIYVEIDKSHNQNIVSVETGSIENLAINKRIVEILEGTMPAFDKRKLKYQ